MPPTGAKGLNLAVSDVHYLADALVDALAGSTTAVDAYSDRALARVWKGRSLLVQPAGQVVGEHRGQHVGGQAVHHRGVLEVTAHGLEGVQPRPSGRAPARKGNPVRLPTGSRWAVRSKGSPPGPPTPRRREGVKGARA